jgi:hypothetical protein
MSRAAVNEKGSALAPPIGKCLNALREILRRYSIANGKEQTKQKL